MKSIEISLLSILVVLSGCMEPTQKREPIPTEKSSLTLIQSMAEHMERENEDIARDAVSIQEDIASADADLDSIYNKVPEEAQETLDIAIDKIWEAEQNAKQVSDSANRMQEEIDQLKNLQDFQTQLINNFGQIEYQIQILNDQKEELIKQFKEFQNQENELGLQLTQKYGDGSIDLTSGLFTKSN